MKGLFQNWTINNKKIIKSLKNKWLNIDNKWIKSLTSWENKY